MECTIELLNLPIDLSYYTSDGVLDDDWDLAPRQKRLKQRFGIAHHRLKREDT